jgi:hypothetical protein
MDGAVELKAPVNVGTVSSPRIFPPPADMLAALLRELPPEELASLRKIPRVLVAPLGSTNRIEVLGAWTEFLLILGILTYPGLRMPSFFGDELWPKLVAEAPSRKNVVHAETTKKRAKTLIKKSS